MVVKSKTTKHYVTLKHPYAIRFYIFAKYVLQKKVKFNFEAVNDVDINQFQEAQITIFENEDSVHDGVEAGIRFVNESGNKPIENMISDIIDQRNFNKAAMDVEKIRAKYRDELIQEQHLPLVNAYLNIAFN